jgi:hypothetical protein
MSDQAGAMQIRCRLGFALIVLAVTLLGAPARAQTEVDLKLALMVDASGSVDRYRFELQKRGYVAALRNPRILGAVLGGRTQSIAISMVQWTGPFLQAVVLPWTQIKDEASIKAAATVIENTPRQLFGGGTSISGAIDYAMAMFPQAPFKSERHVIDVSGDGSNNRGRPAASARDDAVRAGIVINGLPILALEPDLERYYADNVIGGPGAFVIAAQSYETFADAILKKLIHEMAAHEPPPHAGWNIAGPVLLRARLSGFEGY